MPASTIRFTRMPLTGKITFSFALAYMNKATALVHSPRHIPWGCCPPRGPPLGHPPSPQTNPQKHKPPDILFSDLLWLENDAHANLLWKYDYAKLYMKTDTCCVSCNSRKFRETKDNILGETKWCAQ